MVPLSDGAGDRRRSYAGQSWRPNCRLFSSTLVWRTDQVRLLTDRLGANLDGTLAEYAVLSVEAVVPVPEHLSFEEAATLPCAAVTAWVALTGHRRVTAGDTVLTQGSGGVAVFALQFARLLGARVIAMTSTAEKAERLKALGASDVINYSETPIETRRRAS